MKKVSFAVSLMLAASMAYASDVSLEVGRNTAKQTVYTLSTANSVYNVDTVVSASTARLGSRKTDTVSFTVGKTIYLNNFGIGAYVGPQFVRTESNSGYGLKYGFGASYPLTTKVSLVADVSRFAGRKNITNANSSVVSAGISYKF